MSIAARLAAVRAAIAQACTRVGRDPAEVRLLAVSKGHEAAAVEAAMAAGQTLFGENRVQELERKARALAALGPRWHMIGSVQTNKVRALLAIPGLELVHSLDRVALADALQARRVGTPLACLMEIAATGEPDKHGVAVGDAPALLRHVTANCPALCVDGLMAMGPLEGDPAPVFAAVARLREDLRAATGLPLPILSMGMTGDLDAAIAAGSTMVRVGTGVFGARGT